MIDEMRIVFHPLIGCARFVRIHTNTIIAASVAADPPCQHAWTWLSVPVTAHETFFVVSNHVELTHDATSAEIPVSTPAGNENDRTRFRKPGT